MIKTLLLSGLFGLAVSLNAQELNLSVNILLPNALTSTDKAVLNQLEKELNDFFNKNKFTEHEYTELEKIQGSIQLTMVNENSNTNWTFDVSIKSTRPVYNSDYLTPVVNWLDKGVSITYIPGTPIQKSDKAYIDNLSSTVTFYAYMLLGFDYDSFSLYGGEEYFQITREIFNSLPNGTKTDDSAWTNQGQNGRSKYFLMENILSPRLRPFRQVIYEYHRVALDQMWEDAEKNRAIMLSSLGIIDDMDQSYPNSFLLQMFGDTKHFELVEIFKAADIGQKTKLKNIMTKTSKTMGERYESLR
jgi:hypothetical protein